MKRLLAVLLLAGVLTGCRSAALATRLASLDGGGAILCKHCNCYMPADSDPTAQCTVCNCGYRNAQCERGK